MKDDSKQIRMAIALGLLALTGMFFSTLALADIASGKEADLTMEWNIVRVSYLLNLMFIALSITLLVRAGKRSSVD